MKRRPFVALALGAVACALLSWRPSPPRLMWNTTSSVPIGAYWLRPPDALRVGDIVAVDPPPPVARWLATRGLLPAGVPLLKPVAGLPGQVVCRTGDLVTIDGKAIGQARERDRLGRPLPRWSGCHRLAQDELFLMNAQTAASFDGRYFGVTRRADVQARAERWGGPSDDRRRTEGRP
jgi:conjugative transfer signal peptidase TraF